MITILQNNNFLNTKFDDEIIKVLELLTYKCKEHESKAKSFPFTSGIDYTADLPGKVSERNNEGIMGTATIV